jgi:sigma-54 specific flagellar transcriptional regulator A
MSVRPFPTISNSQVQALRPVIRPASRTRIVGLHPAIRRVLDTIERVASTLCTVLVSGESGTGKELVVVALHEGSPRASMPLVTVNCGAIAQNVIEVELFGHAPGGPAGAHSTRNGFVAAAEGGTLFLDEVDELAPQVQVKLLRLIQQREYSPVGETRLVQSDVRVVAATDRDLEAEVRHHRFREDLFCRLSVIHIDLPPLRDRAGDIEALAFHFLRVYSARSGRSHVISFTPEALAALRAYSWPGNVRALETAVERAVLLARGPLVTVDDLPERVRSPEAPPASVAIHVLPERGIDLRAAVDDYENHLISQALRRTGRNKNRAARLLGLSRTTLVEMLKRKGL